MPRMDAAEVQPHVAATREDENEDENQVAIGRHPRSLFLRASYTSPARFSSYTGTKSAGDHGWYGFTSSMEKMHADMAAIGPSGTTDLDFVRLMLPHHRSAIDMAKTQLLYGKDPQMRRLVQEIITDQQSEIALMELWLKQRDRQKHE